MSFDNKMRVALAMWLSRHGMVRLGRFFHSERNFKWSLTVLGVVITIVSLYLFVLLVQFIFIQSPCDAGSACAIGAGG